VTVVTEQAYLADISAILDVLKKNSQAIESHLRSQSQWTEFSREMGHLAGKFGAIRDENDPEAAVSNLEVAVNALFDVCEGYPYVIDLLDQVEETGPGSDEGRLHPPPDEKDLVKIKELSNRFYDLLAQLKKTPAEQTKKDTDDRRTHT
jgi:hypothetical protein